MLTHAKSAPVDLTIFHTISISSVNSRAIRDIKWEACDWPKLFVIRIRSRSQYVRCNLLWPTYFDAIATQSVLSCNMNEMWRANISAPGIRNFLKFHLLYCLWPTAKFKKNSWKSNSLLRVTKSFGTYWANWAADFARAPIFTLDPKNVVKLYLFQNSKTIKRIIHVGVTNYCFNPFIRYTSLCALCSVHIVWHPFPINKD